MLVKKLESLERRLNASMSKSDEHKKKYEPLYNLVKQALDAANEDDHHTALECMNKFSAIANEYKLLNNV